MPIDCAFSGCSELKSITIPNNITFIGSYVFYDCIKLARRGKDNLWYLGNSENPYLYLADADNTNTSIAKVKIDENCRFIGDYAFESCNNLTSITIPNSVTSIGNYAFKSCYNLTSIMIPDSVTFIGEWAFNGCSRLTSITIPDSITSIGAYTFYNCSGLTSVTVGNGVTSICKSAFYDCKKLAEVYYKGTSEDWNKISIDYYNDKLTSAPRYYYSETKPTESGNYWHYNDKNEIEEW